MLADFLQAIASKRESGELEVALAVNELHSRPPIGDCSFALAMQN